MKTTNKSCDTTRRSFLKLSGLLGLGVAGSALLPATMAEAVLFSKKEYKVTRTRLVMGTYVAMTAIHSSKDRAEEAIGEAFVEMQRLSTMLTRHGQDSPVAVLNRTGQLQGAPVEVRQLVDRSLRYTQRTAGAFDITVKPLIDLYQQSFTATGTAPADSRIEAALQVVGVEKMRVVNDTILLTDSDAAITLDGIAKGYIVDRASAILKGHGVNNHVINAGGDIRTSGEAAKGKKWTVAVQDPAKNKHYPDIVEMRDGAIATSGNYEVFYDNEKMFHHILDGRSGHSPQGMSSVTVMAPTVMDADALSTSVFVMQTDTGIDFINRQPGCECLVLESGGRISRSAGWRS